MSLRFGNTLGLRIGCAWIPPLSLSPSLFHRGEEIFDVIWLPGGVWRVLKSKEERNAMYTMVQESNYKLLAGRSTYPAFYCLVHLAVLLFEYNCCCNFLCDPPITYFETSLETPSRAMLFRVCSSLHHEVCFVSLNRCSFIRAQRMQEGVQNAFQESRITAKTVA